MTTLEQPDAVAVWLVDAVPARIVWRGRRFRVTDRPTPIRETTGTFGPTHPTERLVGWRFQGTCDDESLVFDVLGSAASGWRLAAFYA